MGTTLVGFLVIEDSSFVINVGDSRCYVIDQNDNMHLITKDHTLFNDLLAKGNMDEETISKFVTKNIISKAIGITHGIKPDIFEINNNIVSINTIKHTILQILYTFSIVILFISTIYFFPIKNITFRIIVIIIIVKEDFIFLPVGMVNS